MPTRVFQTPRGEARIRLVEERDLAALIELNRQCFPLMNEENVVWNQVQLRNHLRVFPDGQILVELDGQVVGAVATLMVHMGHDPYRPHTYGRTTDGGYFHNHDPQGDSLYGADVYVHPDYQGMGLGHELYEERRRLCRRLNLRRIIAGGRIAGYSSKAADMSPEEYVEQVTRGTL